MADLKPNQIETLLLKITELKDKYQDAKVVLKSYKMKSEKLTQLKRVKKDLNDQIDEEKRSIEDGFLEDKDYEQASNDELTLKNQIKEKNAELRETMAKVNKGQDLSSYDYNIKGEPMKVQVERVVKVYINGSEQK